MIKKFLTASAIVAVAASSASAGSLLGTEEEQQPAVVVADRGLSPVIPIVIGLGALALIASDSSSTAGTTP